MNIALIGYGKMGKTIEQIAVSRGHEIVSIIDINNPDDFSHSDCSYFGIIIWHRFILGCQKGLHIFLAF